MCLTFRPSSHIQQVKEYINKLEPHGYRQSHGFTPGDPVIQLPDKPIPGAVNPMSISFIVNLCAHYQSFQTKGGTSFDLFTRRSNRTRLFGDCLALHYRQFLDVTSFRSGNVEHEVPEPRYRPLKLTCLRFFGVKSAFNAMLKSQIFA